MATKVEGSHAQEALASEGNGTISRDTIILTAGQSLAAMSVIALVAATGKWVNLNPVGAGGAELARGILVDNVDATLADTPAVAIVRAAEVDAAELVYPAGITGPQIITAKANLLALSKIETR
jgi:hypothetical protein